MTEGISTALGVDDRHLNTSPLNYLVLIGLEHVLPALFDRVIVL